MRFLPLIGLLLATACTSPEIRPLRQYEIPTAIYRPVLEEQIVGTLMYEGGCLLFQSHDGTRQLLPIWPEGSTFEETLVTYHQPGKVDERLVIGEEIRLDGKKADWSQLDAVRFAPFQHQCPAEPFFVSSSTPAN